MPKTASKPSYDYVQNDSEEKSWSAYKVWKNYPSYGRKHGFDIRAGLVTGRVVPYVFGTNKNNRTNRNESVIDAENGEKKKT